MQINTYVPHCPVDFDTPGQTWPALKRTRCKPLSTRSGGKLQEGGLHKSVSWDTVHPGRPVSSALPHRPPTDVIDREIKVLFCFVQSYRELYATRDDCLVGNPQILSFCSAWMERESSRILMNRTMR